MGCDIHAQIESKPWQEYQGYWEFATIRHLPRNYAVFAAMANVRNYNEQVEPVAQPRGVPADSDSAIVKRSQDDDWHSHSWLTADEFAEALRRAESEHPAYAATLAMLRALGPSARLVFWFDN